MQCLGGSPGHCTSQHRPAPALHMLSFENFVKSMPPSLSELKVPPSFCFAFKIPDDVAASTVYPAKQFLFYLYLFRILHLESPLHFVFRPWLVLQPLKTFHRVIRNVDLCATAENIVLFTIVKSSCRL